MDPVGVEKEKGSDKESGETCYVCLEEGNCIHSPCECSILVHSECLKSVLSSSGGRKECSVCRGSIPPEYLPSYQEEEVGTVGEPLSSIVLSTLLCSATIAFITSSACVILYILVDNGFPIVYMIVLLTIFLSCATSSLSSDVRGRLPYPPT